MPPRVKRPRSPSLDLATLAKAGSSSSSPQKTKKLKLVSAYASESPFPDWAHPTATEAQEVFVVLSAKHPTHAGERKIPTEENDAARTCGQGMFIKSCLVS
jgi:endonuclease-3